MLMSSTKMTVCRPGGAPSRFLRSLSSFDSRRSCMFLADVCAEKAAWIEPSRLGQLLEEGLHHDRLAGARLADEHDVRWCRCRRGP